MVNKSAEHRNFKEIFKRFFFPSGHMLQIAKRRRIYQHDLIEQAVFVAARHNGKGTRKSAGDYICLFSYHIADEITDDLYIHEIGIGNARFLRTSASQQVDGIYGMLQGKGFLHLIPFISGSAGKNVVDKENRASFAFLCIINFAEAPFIIIPSVCVQHILQNRGSCHNLVDNMNDKSSDRKQNHKRGQAVSVFFHFGPPFPAVWQCDVVR